jgi:hypothetical protein
MALLQRITAPAGAMPHPKNQFHVLAQYSRFIRPPLSTPKLKGRSDMTPPSPFH